MDGQDKGVTAFLTELGEGKLLGADSHWAQSLRHQEYVLYTSQAAAHQAAEHASQANLHAAHQLQKSQDELGRRQAELVAVRSELQSVQRDLQTERDQHQVSRREGEQHAGQAQAERNSHRAQLGKVRRALRNRSDRVNTLEAAAVSARDRARKRFQSVQALRAQRDELLARMPPEVPSFAHVAAAGLRQTTRRTNEPDEAGDTEADPMVPDAEERDTEDQPVWSRDRFTDSAPPWVLNKLRQEHVSLWKTYSSGVLRLLGWSSNQREHKTLGGAVARAFVVLGAQAPGARHGVWDMCSMVLAFSDSLI